MIDSGQRRRNNDPCRPSKRTRKAGGGTDDHIAHADPGVGQDLSPRKLPPDDLNDLRAFCKFVVVQDVAGVQLGEVENRDVRLAQIASLRFLVGIDGPGLTEPPHTWLDMARARSSWDTRSVTFGRLGAMLLTASRARSTSTSGAASTTLRILGVTLPSRIVIWRKASRVTTLPIEWARVEISPTAGSLVKTFSMSSSALRE
jgi:hypothetical protein